MKDRQPKEAIDFTSAALNIFLGDPFLRRFNDFL
jgi:hypothetical protein